MITDEFQKMRQIAAETTLKQAQPEKAAETVNETQGATKVTFDALMQEERRNQNLTKAVHHSRNLGLADAEKTVLAEDKTQQKEEPKKEEPKKEEPKKEEPKKEEPKKEEPEKKEPEKKAPEKKQPVKEGGMSR
jgi:hypothetical protein